MWDGEKVDLVLLVRAIAAAIAASNRWRANGCDRLRKLSVPSQVEETELKGGLACGLSK